MDLYVEYSINYELSFPSEDNSLNPLKLAVEVNFKSFNHSIYRVNLHILVTGFLGARLDSDHPPRPVKSIFGDRTLIIIRIDMIVCQSLI